MIPIRTNCSNFVYRGPTRDIGDAWVERVPAERVVYVVWQPSDEERAYIAAGGNIRLGIHGMEPIPPVSLNTTEEEPLSVLGTALRDRARAELRKVSHGPDSLPAGHWLVSSDVWQELQNEGALDGREGVPVLWGRPLMEVEGADQGTLEYAVAVH